MTKKLTMAGCCIVLQIANRNGFVCLVATQGNREFLHPIINGVAVHHAFEQLFPLMQMAIWRAKHIHIQWVIMDDNDAFYSYEFEEILDRYDLNVLHV